MFDPIQLDAVLAKVGRAPAKEVVSLEGGTGEVYRVDLDDGTSVILKSFEGRSAVPDLDAFAANLLAPVGIPVTQYLLIDKTRAQLPFAFALTTYLLGDRATKFAGHPDYGSLFFQIGALARKLHTITVPSFGEFPEPAYSDSSTYVRALADHAFEQFLHHGADPRVADRLRFLFERNFDAVVPATAQAAFAHDDLHPDNVLIVETASGLAISGLIDFGNARAHSPMMDLAKTMFVCEHMAPGSGPAILEGYGPIDHPSPQDALAFYTMIHRVIMWWWLRHSGVIATPDTPSDIMDALRMTAS